MRMNHFASETGFRMETLSDSRASLDFDLGKGRSQSVSVIDVGDRLCFVAHVPPAFDGIQEVPGFLSNNLLQANNESRLGYWTLVKYDDGSLNYSVDYTVPAAEVTPEFFRSIITDVVGRCGEYYDFMDNLS